MTVINIVQSHLIMRPMPAVIMQTDGICLKKKKYINKKCLKAKQISCLHTLHAKKILNHTRENKTVNILDERFDIMTEAVTSSNANRKYHTEFKLEMRDNKFLSRYR